MHSRQYEDLCLVFFVLCHAVHIHVHMVLISFITYVMFVIAPPVLLTKNAWVMIPVFLMCLQLDLMKSQLASSLLPESPPEGRRSSPLSKHSHLSPSSNNASPPSTSADDGSRPRTAVGTDNRNDEAAKAPLAVVVADRLPPHPHAVSQAVAVDASRQLTDTAPQSKQSLEDAGTGKGVVNIDTTAPNDTSASTPVFDEADFDGWDFED